MPEKRSYTDMAQLGDLLRYHRKRAGLTRAELATLANVGQTVLYELEHGKQTVRFDVLTKIMQTLNLSLHVEGPLVDEYERR